ncbi:histidinol dehydrogenase [Halioglobus japonicus]|uniref:Histidinol dehydrogenase n=1 Tax=Halioglobus japonicus TaxID=930805 RepID=A0AAP8MFW7_9GAMM|nr:histidinol dehydrogenase [Halioglobus japonicus]PLW87130.1 histidinol dehydrogenase [Halioglobus japonicus]GHD10060.1 histidinol dehydrogenase [Halioglobus japonicus]
MQRLDSSQADFAQRLEALTAWEEELNLAVNDTVREVLADVAQRGDVALLEYTARFDQLAAQTMAELEVSRDRLHESLEQIPTAQREALEAAASRIRSYHEHQVQDSWQYRDEQGNLLGQQIRPLDRAGLYVPGGKASYPSSVLMNALPAKVAGVGEIIMVVPAPGGELNPMVLAAAAIAGVDQVFTLGGAQAVGALAYGTATVPAVDKIVGPGNIYVATAKRQVFGRVGIDMIAGPSEILVICDGSTDPDWVAMDLFSQAEHDENAQAILLCPDSAYLDRVAEAIDRLLPDMNRRDIIQASLSGRGAMIKTRDLADAVAISNQLAPEHLELSVADPEQLLPDIRHAGAIFMGPYTSESLGDYCAGPNHVLPTSRSARFSSPLGVYDFQKRSSLIMCSEQGVQTLGEVASVLAHGESLQAHARSAELRLKK